MLESRKKDDDKDRRSENKRNYARAHKKDTQWKNGMGVTKCIHFMHCIKINIVKVDLNIKHNKQQ